MGNVGIRAGIESSLARDGLECNADVVGHAGAVIVGCGHAVDLFEAIEDGFICFLFSAN